MKNFTWLEIFGNLSDKEKVEYHNMTPAQQAELRAMLEARLTATEPAPDVGIARAFPIAKIHTDPRLSKLEYFTLKIFCANLSNPCAKDIPPEALVDHAIKSATLLLSRISAIENK